VAVVVVIVIQGHHAVWEARAAAAMDKTLQAAQTVQPTRAAAAVVVVMTVVPAISRVERAVAVS
jgi:hypothetical protein